MGRARWLLIIGGSLIVTAVGLRLIGMPLIWTVSFFSAGAILKLVFLTWGVRTGRYRLGWEIVMLPIGVSLVVTGVFFKNNPALVSLYGWLIVSGVLCKSSFLFLFFRRQRLKL